VRRRRRIRIEDRNGAINPILPSAAAVMALVTCLSDLGSAKKDGQAAPALSKARWPWRVSHPAACTAVCDGQRIETVPVSAIMLVTAHTTRKPARAAGGCSSLRNYQLIDAPPPVFAVIRRDRPHGSPCRRCAKCMTGSNCIGPCSENC